MADHGGATVRSGFTLIELVVVVLIIGLLAAIALPNYIKVKEKAREAETKATVHNIQISLESYGVDYQGEYPRYLIGGEARAKEVLYNQDGNIELRITETPKDQASDVLIREGYVDAYQKNPFISNGGAVEKFQAMIGDPLRSTLPDGKEMGTRFGPNGNTVGQCLCDARYLTWLARDPATGELFERDTWSNIQYDFYDVWYGNQKRPYLSGEFFYKSVGEIVPQGEGNGNSDVVVTEGGTAVMPHASRNNVVYPLARTNYVLGAWGGQRNKGMDVLGEEPMVVFAYEQKFKRNRQIARVSDGGGGLGAVRPVVTETGDEISLLGLPSWTRGVNRSHIGPLWGSPFSVSDEFGEQLSNGNANGIRDAVIIMLTNGEH